MRKEDKLSGMKPAGTWPEARHPRLPCSVGTVAAQSKHGRRQNGRAGAGHVTAIY